MSNVRRLNPSTAWSILQGLKIINGQFVLGGEFYYSWFEFAVAFA